MITSQLQEIIMIMFTSNNVVYYTLVIISMSSFVSFH